MAGRLFSPRGGGMVAGCMNEATKSLLQRMTGVNATRAGHINALIVALKAAGVWAKLDVLQVYAAHNEAAALLNWKGSTWNATNNGATFVVDGGFYGDGAATWVSTGFTPSAGVQYQRDSAHAGLWIDPDGASTNGHGSSTTLYVRHASGNITGRINDATTATFGVASANGHHMLVRRAADDKRAFVNGAQVGSTLTTASTGVSSNPFGVGRWNTNATYTNDQVPAFHAGAALSDVEAAALYAAVRVYMTAVGIP